MSQAKREQLSNLMDDALDAVEIPTALEQLSSDADLRADWDRYHLIGDALRGEAVSIDVGGIADRVRAELDKDPEMRASPPLAFPNRRFKPVLGYALAASVVMAVLLTGSGFLQTGEEQAPMMLAGLDTPAAVPAQKSFARPAASNPPLVRYVDNTGTYWSLEKPEVEGKLNHYLLNHQQFAPSSHMKGMLPYATFVSYDSRR